MKITSDRQSNSNEIRKLSKSGREGGVEIEIDWRRFLYDLERHLIKNRTLTNSEDLDWDVLG